MTRRERLERKLEKREEWAGKARERSAARFKAVSAIADNIPLGQPILVGHHSEKRARKDQARIVSGMTKGLEEGRLADHHEGKAGGLAAQLARTTFSDDPDALDQLAARIAKLEAECERKTSWNAAWKRGAAAGEKKAKAKGKTSAEDLLIARLDGGEQALREAGHSQAIILAANTSMEPGYSWVKAPFDMTHLRAEIRRLKGRVEEITRQQARQARAEAAGGVTIARSADGFWCTVTFAEKPERSILEALRDAGYRFGAGSWSGYLKDLPPAVVAMEATNKQG